VTKLCAAIRAALEGLPASVVRRIGAEAMIDAKTLRRVRKGRLVRQASIMRLARSLHELGLLDVAQTSPSPSTSVRRGA
jgi:hypothetical protein